MKSLFTFLGFFFVGVIAAFAFLIVITIFTKVAFPGSHHGEALSEAIGYYFIPSVFFGYIMFFILRNRLNYWIITLLFSGICLAVFYLMGAIFEGTILYIILSITLVNFLGFFYVALIVPNKMIQRRAMISEADTFD